MLSDEIRKRVTRQVQQFTNAYTASKNAGYDVKSMSLPIFDSQEDFDICRPEEKGTDFRDHNEFIAEVIKGLIANAVPSRPVVFRHAEFSKWLDGRTISAETRSAYAGHLGAEADRKNDQQH